MCNTSRPKVLTVIVSFNFMPWIDRCLSSLKDSSFPTDVFVIDNGSRDDTVNHLTSYYHWVKTHYSPRNLGFGQANNLGFLYALENNYDYVFLLNQDAWVDKESIKTLVNFAMQADNFGIFSPLHLKGDYSGLDTMFSNYVASVIGDETSLSYPNLKLRGLQRVGFVNAAAWFIPQRVLHDVGGFDPLFFHYGEDRDFFNRVVFHGWDVGVVFDTSICHDRQAITKEKKVRRLTNYGVARASNLNKPFLGIWTYSLLYLVIGSIYSLLRGRLVKAKKFFSEAKTLLYSTSKILQSRKRNSTRGTHYITQDY